jgi:(p)ppGpp synthase/HD superfamily hydrolase
MSKEFGELTDIFTSDLVKRALAFAAMAHDGQSRKYSGEPYITHPVIVAGLVASVGGTKTMVAAALLHDVVEDCDVKIDILFAEFGQEVANLVYWLTDVSTFSDGNRIARKALDREHLAKAPAEAQTIKLADLIDNTSSIVKYDPDFAKVYMKEKLALLDVLTNGDTRLYARAAELVANYFKENANV